MFYSFSPRGAQHERCLRSCVAECRNTEQGRQRAGNAEVLGKVVSSGLYLLPGMRETWAVYTANRE